MRNELLYELFQRSHLIEKWGRGVKLILSKETATEFEEVGSTLFCGVVPEKRIAKRRLGQIRCHAGKKFGEN